MRLSSPPGPTTRFGCCAVLVSSHWWSQTGFVRVKEALKKWLRKILGKSPEHNFCWIYSNSIQSGMPRYPWSGKLHAGSRWIKGDFGSPSHLLRQHSCPLHPKDELFVVCYDPSAKMNSLRKHTNVPGEDGGPTAQWFVQGETIYRGRRHHLHRIHLLSHSQPTIHPLTYGITPQQKLSSSTSAKHPGFSTHRECFESLSLNNSVSCTGLCPVPLHSHGPCENRILHFIVVQTGDKCWEIEDK